MKSILVTGGAGFIGSHFIQHLLHTPTNFILINLDALTYAPNQELAKSFEADKRYKLVKGNICDLKLIQQLFEQYQFDSVFHFAAESHVDNSISGPSLFIQTNINGTFNLIETAKQTWMNGPFDIKPEFKHARFHHVSTDEVYGESINKIDESHKTEHSILCPTNPYAGTKAGAELIAQSYAHSFKLPIIITRGNNVYGPNQYPEKVIPRFIKLLQHGQPVTIQGDGSCVRAFLHSYDTSTAFKSILERGQIGEIYNIGCDEGMEYSILEIAKKLIHLVVYPQLSPEDPTIDYNKHITYIEDRPYNDQRYYISNDRLKSLGWKITTTLDTGLKNLVTI